MIFYCCKEHHNPSKECWHPVFTKPIACYEVIRINFDRDGHFENTSTILNFLPFFHICLSFRNVPSQNTNILCNKISKNKNGNNYL